MVVIEARSFELQRAQYLLNCGDNKIAVHIANPLTQAQEVDQFLALELLDIEHLHGLEGFPKARERIVAVNFLSEDRRDPEDIVPAIIDQLEPVRGQRVVVGPS